MRFKTFAIASLAAGFACAPAFADEICHERTTQFGKLRHCVTSVRTSEGAITFGPEQLDGTGNSAWCSSSGNGGTRPVITLYEEPKATIRTINITNGNATSDESYRASARVKNALLETDRGYRATITLKDTRAPQIVIIAKARIGWVRLTILDTYPSKPATGVCLNEFLVNVEEFANE